MSKRSGFKKLLVAVAAVGLGVFSASKAQAGFTTINPAYPGEQSVSQILTHVYGSTNAIRINDNFDQFAPFNILSAKAIASFASYSQSFGYGSTSHDHVLFDVTGSGYNVNGSTGAVDLPFLTQWIRGGQGTAESSFSFANVDHADHMVTYLLEPTAKSKNLTFVLFFEDKTVGQKGDFDFNDLAVEVKVGCGPAVVPLPAAAWSGLVTLAGGALMTGYRKARRRMV
jgi:hypothetical protein